MELMDNLENATITKGSGKETAVVHSKDAAVTAIRLKAASDQKNLQATYKTFLQKTTIIRIAVKRVMKTPCSFHGSLRNELKSRFPQELVSVLDGSSKESYL